MHLGKNIGTGLIVLLPSVSMLRFESSSVSTLTGSYDITRNKLIANPQSGLCAHIILKTCFFKEDNGKGMQLLGSL